MSDLSLAEIRALSAVAAARGFRRAAVTLGVSPSALSHTIAGLEKRLGVRLFNRTTRAVSLTEAGAQFLARVGPALAAIDAAVEDVNDFRDQPKGLLRLNAAEGAALRILPVVLEFLAAYPEMRVDVVAEGRLVDIVAEGFDAGLRLAESVPQDMVAVPLGPEEAMIVVASPDYLARHGTPIAPADLAGHECLRARLPSGTVLRWEFERRGEIVRLDPPGRLTLGTVDLTRAAALSGFGLAYVGARGTDADLAAGRLVRVLKAWTPSYPGVCLYYPHQRQPSAGLAAFVEYVHATRRRHEAGVGGPTNG
jgi:DNA-binding transcriptional LysR family regulator